MASTKSTSRVTACAVLPETLSKKPELLQNNGRTDILPQNNGKTDFLAKKPEKE